MGSSFFEAQMTRLRDRPVEWSRIKRRFPQSRKKRGDPVEDNLDETVAVSTSDAAASDVAIGRPWVFEVLRPEDSDVWRAMLPDDLAENVADAIGGLEHGARIV